MLKTLNANTGVVRKSPSRMTMDITTVNPGIAQAWLDKNTGNRTLSKKHVQSLARDMKAGKWKLTGDAIRFDTSGRLIDGQHRLEACVLADVSFDTLVIYNLDPEHQSVIDTARPRSAADMLVMAGAPNVSRTLAGLRLLLAWKAGYFSTANIRFTNTELLEALDQRPKINVSATITHGAAGIPPSIIIFMHYIGAFVLERPDRAEAFVNVFKTGIPDYDGCPAQKLRERVLRARGEKQKLRDQEMIRGVVRTWNAFVVKQPLEIVRWNKDVEVAGLDVSKI